MYKPGSKMPAKQGAKDSFKPCKGCKSPAKCKAKGACAAKAAKK